MNKQEYEKMTREDIANLVIKYRLTHNLSQIRLGQLCGVSRWTIARIEACTPINWRTALKVMYRLTHEAIL